MNEQVVALAVRVEVLEREVTTLREARHDHATRLHALMETTRHVREQVDKLEGLPAVVSSLGARLTELEDALCERMTALEKQNEEDARRLKEIEGRLKIAGFLTVVGVEALSQVVHRFL